MLAADYLGEKKPPEGGWSALNQPIKTANFTVSDIRGAGCFIFTLLFRKQPENFAEPSGPSSR